MTETIRLSGTMPPEGDPLRYRTRFPVFIVAQGQDINPGWTTTVSYLSPDPAYTGINPESLLIGFLQKSIIHSFQKSTTNSSTISASLHLQSDIMI